jgi:hypothetical protein
MSKQTDNITNVSLDEPIEQLEYQRRISDSMMTLKTGDNNDNHDRSPA